MGSEGIRRMLKIAGRRLSLITAGDLRELGFSRDQVSNLVRSGVLTRIHRGVYLASGSALTFEQRALAACLACGDAAVVSDRTAGTLWRLVPATEEPVRITVPSGRRPRPPGVIVRRRELGPRDVTRLGPIPITRVPRTIADLDKALRATAADEAIRRGLVAPQQLLGFDRNLDDLARDREHHGVPESELERRAIAMIERHRLPAPVRQHPVGRYRIDLAYPDVHLAIELDGYEHHVTRGRWSNDLRRQNELEIAGWRVLRFTWRDITEQQPETVAQVRRALSATRSPSRGARSAPRADR